MTDLLRAYDRDCRANVRVGDPMFQVERDGPVTRIVGPTDVAYENTVVWARLSASTADAEIRKQIEHFDSLGRDFEWKHFEHDEPKDLGDRLSRAGFEKGEPETLMFLDVAAAPIDRRTSRFDVRKIGPDRLGDVMRLQGEGFGWLEAGLRRELGHDPDSLSIYVAYAGEAPAACGWIRFGPRFATIHGGSTLPEWRERGAYSAILARRLGEARARGVDWLVSDSTEMSRPRLERRGFVVAGRTTPFVRRKTTNRAM